MEDIVFSLVSPLPANGQTHQIAIAKNKNGNTDITVGNRRPFEIDDQQLFELGCLLLARGVANKSVDITSADELLDGFGLNLTDILVETIRRLEMGL